MFKDCSRQELFFLAFAVLLGAWFRFGQSDNLAVEHFDEGVYWSATWYDAVAAEPYPARHLYAPPLLPKMISMLAAVPGLNDVAPFLPSMILGTIGVVGFWWVGRMFFGSTAGYVAAIVVAFNDSHILFSRMALTDVPVLTCTVLAVGFGAAGIDRRCFHRMILAGLLSGIGWWFKYTGWLPIAIVSAGSGLWWLVSGRHIISVGRLLSQLLVMAGVAFVIWCPWLVMLQSVGGYAAVQENHAGYVEGLAGWQDRLADHLTYQLVFDSWLSAAALAMGLLVGGTRRWYQLRNSNETGSSLAAFPATALLFRIVTASSLVAIMALIIGSPLLLICLAVGGFSGMVLFPVFAPLHQLRSTSAEPSSARVPYTDSDRATSPTLTPGLGTSVVFVWLVAMLYVTPQYTSFPRLSLTLMSSLWLAAAGGYSWWVEALINRERLQPPEKSYRSVQGMAVGLVGVIGFLLFNQAITPRSAVFFNNRTSLRDASWTLAKAVLADSAGQYTRQRPVLAPEDVLNDDVNVSRKPVPVVEDRTALTEMFPPKAVVYAIGEPAVLGHLASAGIIANPVTTTTVTPASYQGTALPTYLLIGPNTLRSPGFIEQWLVDQYRFERVDEFSFEVGPVVALNLFPQSWLKEHDEAFVQTLELYRLKPSE